MKIAAATLVAGAAALAASLVLVSGPHAAEATDPAPHASEAVAVGTVTRSLSQEGTIQAGAVWDISSDGATRRTVDATASTAGEGGLVVRSVTVKDGQRVKAGQVLARFDRTLLQLQRTTAQQQLTAAQDARDELAGESGTITTTSASSSQWSGGGTAPVATASVVSVVPVVVADTARAAPESDKPAAEPPADETPSDETPSTETPTDEKPTGDGTGGSDPDTDTSGGGGDKPDSTTGSNAAGGSRGSSARSGGSSASTTTTSQSASAAQRSADARVLEAQSAFDTADTAWRNAILRAPAAGVVTAVNVTAGQLTPSGPAITIRAGGSTVDIAVSEADIVGLKTGTSAVVTVDAIDVALEGIVASIGVASGSAAEGSVVTYPVTVTATGAAPSLRIGMTATVSLEIASSEDVLVVPAASLRDETPWMRTHERFR
jgi:multidrug efflux pump subunit AcrA (membrane-fusion protein)